MKDLPEAPERWYCEECKTVTMGEPLRAQSPFDADDYVIGCPKCRAVNTLTPACWKCDNPASGATPFSGVYRYVWGCNKHFYDRSR